MWRVLGDSQAPGTQRQRRGEHRVCGEEREGAMGLLLISPPQLISALINLLAVCKWSRQSKDNEEVPEPPFPKLSLLPCCGLDVPILSGLPCPSEHPQALDLEASLAKSPTEGHFWGRRRICS